MKDHHGYTLIKYLIISDRKALFKSIHKTIANASTPTPRKWLSTMHEQISRSVFGIADPNAAEIYLKVCIASTKLEDIFL